MADYSIDDDKWNERKDMLREWHDANPDHQNLLDIANAIFGIGDAQPEYRKKHWASVRSLYVHLQYAPVSSRRTMPADVYRDMNAYLTTVEDAYTAFYEEYGWMLGMTLRPHGKTGRTHYEDAGEYASDQTSKARHFLTRAYTAHVAGDATSYRWDGTFAEDGVVDVTLPTDDSDEGV